MKTTVLVGALLLVVAGATGGYYAAKVTNPAPRAKAVERVDSDRDKLTRNLMEVKADVAEIGISIDLLTDMKEISRKRQCLQDADEAIEEAKAASMMWDHCAKSDDCGQKEFYAYTTAAVTKNDKAPRAC